MITAVDTNVLVDVLTADPDHGAASRAALAESLQLGKLVVSEVVWSEVAAGFRDSTEARSAINGLHVEFASLGEPAATAAGSAWRHHRKSGGERSRMIADFLIGAHALHEADRLLTRDRGFFRRYFAGLTIVVPAENAREPESSDIEVSVEPTGQGPDAG